MNIKELAAEAYAATLRAGDTILTEVDWVYVKPIFALLPAALWRRGLRLDRFGTAGWIVKAVEPYPDNVFATGGNEDVTGIQCRECLANWWTCPCRGHLPLVAFDESAVGRRGAQA